MWKSGLMSPFSLSCHVHRHMYDIRRPLRQVHFREPVGLRARKKPLFCRAILVRVCLGLFHTCDRPWSACSRSSNSSPVVVRCCASSVYIEQIQTRKPVLGHADYTAPTRQHEVDRTRSGIDLPCLADLDHDLGIDYLSQVWMLSLRCCSCDPAIPFFQQDF